MGFSKNHHQPSLKPISTRPTRDAIASQRSSRGNGGGGGDEGEECGSSSSSLSSPTTPTTKESRIPERLPCPPAPRKRRPTTATTTGAGLCHLAGSREFFNPPDLESVFKFHFERAN